MNSSQLDLFEAELAALPWRGVSPRVLTRGWNALFLQPEAQKNERFFVDPGQYDLWPSAKRAPRVYRGAPSLLPLPKGRQFRLGG